MLILTELYFFIADSNVVLNESSSLNINTPTIRIQKTLQSNKANLDLTGEILGELSMNLSFRNLV